MHLVLLSLEENETENNEKCGGEDKENVRKSK